MAVEASSAETGVTTQSAVLAEVAAKVTADAAATDASKATVTDAAADAAKAEAAPKDEPKKERDSARWAAIARRDKELRAREQQIKAEKDSVAKERAEIEAFRKAQQAAKSDPLGYLKAAGLDYNSLTQAVLADGKPPPELAVKAVEDKFDSYVRQQEEDRQKAVQAEQDRIQAEAKQLTEQFHRECKEFVTSHADEYELTNLYEAHEYVIALLEESYHRYGKSMQYKEAADAIEKHFEEKAAQSKKLAKKFAPVAKVDPEPEREEKRTEAAPRKTLSNSMTASTPAKARAKPEDDAMKRAQAAYDAVVAAKKSQAKR